MTRPAGPWHYLDDLGISVCLATGLIAIYSTWIAKYSVDFIAIVFGVPIYLFWGFAMGLASSPWAWLSMASTVLILLLVLLALRFVRNRLVCIAVVTALFCVQVAAVTLVGKGIHFLERA